MEKVEIFKTIFNAMVTKEKVDSFLGREGNDKLLRTIINATEYTDTVMKELYPETKSEDDEIFANDVVILSVNGGQPTRYFLNYYPIEHYYRHKPNSDGKKEPVIPNYNYARKVENYHFLDAHSSVGKRIIGNYVNDVIYLDNGQNVRILAHKRTVDSFKIKTCELLADDEYQSGRIKR